MNWEYLKYILKIRNVSIYNKVINDKDNYRVKGEASTNSFILEEGLS